MSKDGTRVLVEIVGVDATASLALDAHDLDNVIQNLGQARAKMTPAFPRRLDPKPVFRNVVKGGAFHISGGRELPETKARVCLGVLHPGFGWMAFSLSPNEAMELAAHIATKANEVGQGVRLVGPDGKPLA
jgi:hypothetical protein